ncbi:MAG TPA: hypothetical protein VK717_09825 [Opitutaceae bacterium]|nr:hypothetical protein [Opitutaceae bacterium]
MPSRLLSAVLFLAGTAATLHGGTTDARLEKIAVEPVTTSIYIGYVKLTTPTFARAGDDYTASYQATVFPFFFWGEHGELTIEASAQDLQRLERGETVEFKGHAKNSDGETRPIEGRAVPQDATRGKLKVRVFVSSRIQLIFNTTYRFVGGS